MATAVTAAVRHRWTRSRNCLLTTVSEIRQGPISPAILASATTVRSTTVGLYARQTAIGRLKQVARLSPS